MLLIFFQLSLMLFQLFSSQVTLSFQHQRVFFLSLPTDVLFLNLCLKDQKERQVLHPTHFQPQRLHLLHRQMQLPHLLHHQMRLHHLLRHQMQLQFHLLHHQMQLLLEFGQVEFLQLHHLIHLLIGHLHLQSHLSLHQLVQVIEFLVFLE